MSMTINRSLSDGAGMGAGSTSRHGLAVAALEHLETAVLVLDETLHLRGLNPAAEALLAVSANQVIATPLAGFVPRAQLLISGLQRVVQTGVSMIEREMKLPLESAEPVTVDCSVTPMTDGGGTRLLLIELSRRDRYMQIAREEQLVAQNESARALVRGLAHEIKNPLGGLRGAAQLLQRELGAESLREYTRVIIGEADRLQNLVDRMLGPRTLPKRERVNVHRVTERVRALIVAESPPTVAVVRDYDPSIPDLTGDPERLIQAVLNVARNAVEALEGKGQVVFRTRIQRQITIGPCCHRLAVRVDIVDDGKGIAEALRSQIFYPLVTGRDGGTGLGLSIAQSLINQHGGLIECRAALGETTFSIILPVEDASR